jgi:hypothetical protein
MGTGTFQLTNPSAESNSWRNPNCQMDVIFYPSHLEQEGPRSLGNSMSKVSIQAFFNISSNSRAFPSVFQVM